ncbi:type IV pilus modification protein PilV [Marinimicrobium alkaliphilum]|uniref:type IV pilus modification protein PilV n=1 Tax=Marinimicrobium alkaliphilum TaxID=2202654 RepID=UPI0018E096C5|nr:type IV pilus modification protein PilV [Marinimicrobium alkaliphilum]
MKHSRKRQGGVGLIEVLVTVLILAVSLLTIAALQTRSLQYNHSAYLRSQANILAYDILDRMRINQGNLNAYSGLDFGDEPAGTSLAATDVGEWLAVIERTLPGGEGAITCTNRLCTVSIRWSEQDSAGDDDLTDFSYTTQL